MMKDMAARSQSTVEGGWRPEEISNGQLKEKEKCRSDVAIGGKSREAMPESVASPLLPSIVVLRLDSNSRSSAITGPNKFRCTGFWSLHSFRHGLTWVLCFVMLANAWSRGALSMAMVCMVNMTAVAKRQLLSSNSSIIEDVEDCGSLADDHTVDYGGDIIWTSAQQGVLFSAIFWGSAIVGLPGSWFINRYGSKRVVLGCLAITLFCTMALPLAAMNGGLLATFLVRFFMGFGGELVLNTAITVIISHWIPPTERSTVLALYTAGNQIAIIVGMPVNALLCRNKEFLGGWPAIFYVTGVIVFMAAIAWQIFIDDTPSQSRWISRDERSYIEKSLQSQNMGISHDTKHHVPWRHLLLSNAMWSCVASIFAAGLSAATIHSYLPTYYKEVLRIDLKSNGLFSAIPFLCQLVSKMIFAVAADAMKRRTRISHTAICKGFNVIGTFVASAFLMASALMTCHEVVWAIVLLSLANTAYSGFIPGTLTALVCFAPAYTGVVNGLARLAAQIASIGAPYIVGAITTMGTAEEWRIVFYIISGVTTTAGVYFFCCGTVEIQEWAKIQEISEDTPDHEKSNASSLLANGTGETTETETIR